jgi:leader peptidase (prepilin peptidase) / N-methyltransferase
MFHFLGIVYFAATTLPLVWIDLRERRLPNNITLPGIAISFFGLALTFDWMRLLLVMAIAGGIFTVGTLISLKGFIGMGDVKLMTGLSLLLTWFSPHLLWQSLLWTFLSAGVFVLGGLMFKKITTRSTIALGPYLLVGFWLVVTEPAWSSIVR